MMMIRLLPLALIITPLLNAMSAEHTIPSIKKLVTLKPFEKKGYTEILVNLRNHGIVSMKEIMPAIIEEIKHRTEGKSRTSPSSKGARSDKRMRSRKSLGSGSEYRIHMDLGSNMLKEIDAEHFDALDGAGYSLHALHLDRNLLSTFPHDIVTTCERLAILTLSNNQIAAFDDELTASTTHLAYLDMTYNKLTVSQKELIRHAIHPNCTIVFDGVEHATSMPKNGRQHRASSSDSVL